MNQTFFLGDSSHKRCQELDLSTTESLLQLKSSLGVLFSFADPEAIRFYSPDGKLLTIGTIKECSSPVELRVADDGLIRPPPGPKPLPFVGNHYDLYPDALGNYDRLFSRYGPIIKTTNFGTVTYHTNDPEISRHVLREGELFTKTTSDPSHPLFYMSVQTALFTCDTASPSFAVSYKFVPPALSPVAASHHAPRIQNAARSILPVLDMLEKGSLAMNVYHYMFKLAGQLIWQVVLGQNVKYFQALNTPPTIAIRLFGQYLSLMKKSSLKLQCYGKLPFGEPAQLRRVTKDLFDTVEQAMDSSVTPGAETLPLKDPTSPQRASCIADYLCRVRDERGRGLPREELLANVVVTLGAGFTTTSSLLSWSLYSLTKYPGNQERLLQEMIDHGADGKRAWSWDDVHAMKFLDCFVKETKHMHSPSFQAARNAKVDAVLSGGYLIPKGSVVITCFPSLHKNPAHWDNPGLFDPDRWAEGDLAAKARRKGVYTPFAAGGRGCIGFNLALMQVKVVLLELVYHYHFEDASPEPVVYDPEFLVTRPLNFYACPKKPTSWPERFRASTS